MFVIVRVNLRVQMEDADVESERGTDRAVSFSERMQSREDMHELATLTLLPPLMQRAVRI